MPNPEIEWKSISGLECLYFKFGRVLTESDAREASQRWKNEFKKNPGIKICVIWDCLEMKNYDKPARVIWQETINELRESIDTIWLITGSLIISVGASVIATLTGLRINTVSSLGELQLKKNLSEKK